MASPHKIALNSTTTFNTPVVESIDVAKRAGFAGVELQDPWVDPYLAAGGTVEDLLAALDGFPVAGVGALQEDEPDRFAAQARRLAEIAAGLGATQMQMCTGPVDVAVVEDFVAGTLRQGDPRYRGAVGRPERDALAMTTKNVQVAADIAAEFGLDVYLEPLAWAPLNSLRHGLQVVEAAGRPNVGVTIDFWHCFYAGDTPDDVARVDPALIKAVHVCDSKPFPPGVVPNQAVYRDVPTGGGVVPLQEWVDAVKATGYDGWYATEIFCRKTARLDPLLVATTMRGQVEILVS
ncbi:MAG: sugar phosphate isomerase/epimerase [Propionibacteriaceae bacterium]|jgi:sugar phosphate isomerase/epimerase|nr:sugar phosphate isomerase/epimerase [Propionibacteriaceae bacterium]